MRLAVSRLGGAAKLAAGDPSSRTVSVEYEPAVVSVEAILEALEGVGYEASVEG